MESIEATVVTTVPVGMFDDPLFSSLKELTYEQLLSQTIDLIDGLDLKELTDSDFKEVALLKAKNKQGLHNLVLLLGESWRRDTHMIDPMTINLIMEILEDECCVFCKETKSIDYCFHHAGIYQCFANPSLIPVKRVFGVYVTNTSLLCSPCKIQQSIRIPNATPPRETIGDMQIQLIDEVKGWLDKRQILMYSTLRTKLQQIRPWIEDKQQKIQLVKDAMLKILTTPLLTKQLEECMDEILDCNGNKISQMKDYLTEEQYRFVRSGNHFEEFPKQQELLTNLLKMRDELKPKPIAAHVLEL